jgi:hypothetical protein
MPTLRKQQRDLAPTLRANARATRARQATRALAREREDRVAGEQRSQRAARAAATDARSAAALRADREERGRNLSNVIARRRLVRDTPTPKELATRHHAEHAQQLRIEELRAAMEGA